MSYKDATAFAASLAATLMVSIVVFQAGDGNGLGTQAVIAFEIGFGFKAQDQGLRRVDIRAAGYLAVHQAMQQIQNVDHGGNQAHRLPQGP